jgi:RND family efflux transporter MFP subunit
MSLIRGCVGLVLGCVVAAPALAQGPPPASVVVDTSRLELIEQRRPVTGQLVAARRSIVAAEEPGIVIEVPVREGDTVKVGDVIARLDSARAAIALLQAEANASAAAALVRQREFSLDQSKRDLVRLKSAADQRSASEQETDNALTFRDRAEAGLEQAKAQSASAVQRVALAKERLDDLTILAPFSGVIVSKRTELGQWLDVGDAVVEMVDLDSIEAVLDVPERFVDRLSRDGASVQVHVIAIGEMLEAPITRIIPLADDVARMFPVHVALGNGPRRLRPGMSVTGLVPTGVGAQTLTVHKDAIMRDTGGEFVFFSSGGRAATARVRILFGAGDRVAISSSQLTPDVEVVIEGNELLSPGQPLQILGAVGSSSPGKGTGSPESSKDRAASGKPGVAAPSGEKRGG